MVAKRVILMCKDVVVAQTINERNYVWEIFREDLIPKNLKIITKEEYSEIQARLEGSSPEKIAESLATLYAEGYISFIEWCSSRVLSIDRVYAKKILNSLGLSQGQSKSEKAKIALQYRALSLVDSYWLRYKDDDKAIWEEISLRHNLNIKSLFDLIPIEDISENTEDDFNFMVDCCVNYYGRYENFSRIWYNSEKFGFDYRSLARIFFFLGGV